MDKSGMRITKKRNGVRYTRFWLLLWLMVHASIDGKNSKDSKDSKAFSVSKVPVQNMQAMTPLSEATVTCTKKISKKVTGKKTSKKQADKARKKVSGKINSRTTALSSVVTDSELSLKEIASIATVPASFKIRVLLESIDHTTTESEKSWRLSSPLGFIIQDTEKPYKKIIIETSDIDIQAKKGTIFINKRPFTEGPILISPRTMGNTSTMGNTNNRGSESNVSTCMFKGKCYRGSFLVTCRAHKLLLINNVDLEEYVWSVLHTESWPGWPLEIHKVCAIACRSYAIATALRAQKVKKPYHIKNTNEHQTYGGSHTNTLLKQAVNDTRGIFMAYNNQPILAMYDICCGGVIPAHISNFDFQQAPYLARTYACLYCKPCKSYSWETSCAVGDFEQLISKMVKKVSKIKSVGISKKDKAGLVCEVVLKNSGAPLTVSGQKMYSLMKEIRSLCFQTWKKGNQIIIKGRGYGHHLGLCQWGAREMVRNGWSHKRILQFYYPGIEFMRVS